VTADRLPCEPTKCANATINPEHAPAWRQSLLHVDHVLADREPPRNERERLATERARIASLFDGLEAT
jgi:hypothetical protein